MIICASESEIGASELILKTTITIATMLKVKLLVLLISICFGVVEVNGQLNSIFPALGGYCSTRPKSDRCCRLRQDDCSLPYLDTICYCDEFCQRDFNSDCCPDYRPLCGPQNIELGCYHNGRLLNNSATFKDNCNTCTCRIVSPTRSEFICEQKPCLVRPELIQKINEEDHGWKAANYTFFWGKTLEEGYKNRAGICKPEPLVLKQNSVQNAVQPPNGIDLAEEFDSRRHWPRLIRAVSDQMDYPASWAISTVDVASDRLAIQSKGEHQVTLSAQNLIACINPRKNHCATASTDRAWWYMCAFGVVSDDCYPYRSGFDGQKQRCHVTRDTWSDTSRCSPDGRVSEGMLYRSPPAYRVNSKEEDIMTEIQTNGPVQALLHVKSDFFSYKSGVYRHTTKHSDEIITNGHNVHRYLAVRIIGWGVDRSNPGKPLKFWLCANSWGQQWGENGYFRIIRGQDECEIEMFVVGVWAKKPSNGQISNNYIQ
ncbi:hypothetical protein CHUAL_007747 [Chamberlinius hualienensis]